MKSYKEQLREIQSLKLKDLHEQMKRMKKRGLKPHIKGKGCGNIKIEFDD